MPSRTVTSLPLRVSVAIAAVAGLPAAVTVISYVPRKPHVAYVPSLPVVPSALVHHFLRTRSNHAWPAGLMLQSLRHSAAFGRQ